MGYQVLSNDWQTYAAYMAKASVQLSEFPTFELLGAEYTSALDVSFRYTSAGCREGVFEGPAASVLAYLNGLTPKHGLFTDLYCENGSSGRLFFSAENGGKIQAIRECIESWKTMNKVTELEYAWLVATLIESADRVANTASVYEAYLKKLKPIAQKPLELVAPKPVPSLLPCKVYSEDAFQLLGSLSQNDILLTYIDPPYNHRQYSGNYHLLETLACWDLERFSPRGVAGTRPLKEKQSAFSFKKRVWESFDVLFSLIRSRYVMLSYSNEGLLSKKQIQHLFDRYCTDTVFRRVPYNRFKADKNHSERRYRNIKTSEYLVFGKVKKDSL
jgi:adenine-specific DNA-methyltransferase